MRFQPVSSGRSKSSYFLSLVFKFILNKLTVNLASHLYYFVSTPNMIKHFQNVLFLCQGSPPLLFLYFKFQTTCCLLQIVMILCIPHIISSAFWNDERSCGHFCFFNRTRIYGSEFTPLCYVYSPRLYGNILGFLPLISFQTLNKQYRQKQHTQFYNDSYSYSCLLHLFHTNPGIRSTLDYLSFLLLVTEVYHQILSVRCFLSTYRLVYHSTIVLLDTLGLAASPFFDPPLFILLYENQAN